ncbi:Hypothetical_protein [Hexamita inflata]|uniref:Hypothetical_protein n=1 Tax=Hexamita inflata TaxID=28002 RepID=A0AA86VSX0_9EUKA|nr:Hypothetical protein HINF_LOCUS64248 [Hexamita inflata]
MKYKKETLSGLLKMSLHIQLVTLEPCFFVRKQINITICKVGLVEQFEVFQEIVTTKSGKMFDSGQIKTVLNILASSLLSSFIIPSSQLIMSKSNIFKLIQLIFNNHYTKFVFEEQQQVNRTKILEKKWQVNIFSLFNKLI